MAPDEKPPAPLGELADHAARVRVAVVGAGIAGLVAARECAKVGLRVTVFERDAHVGGTLRTRLLDGVPVDTGAVGFAARSAEVAALVDDAGLADDVVEPATETRWVVDDRGAAAMLPDDTLLGIPENVFSEPARAILGGGGTWRAYLDRVRPPLTIGHERRLDALVRARMGQKVLDRLVAPLTRGVYGAEPGEIDVDAAAPGLNAALTRAGSLSGAVGLLRADRADGPGVRGIRGGMSRLAEAIAERLTGLGADVRCGAEVTAIEPTGAVGGWIVHTVADEFDATTDQSAPERFDAVIVATGERTARALLAPVAPALDDAAPAGAAVETVTLLLDAPALDAAPRGAEAVASGRRAAASVQHLTAQWPWLAEAAAGRHVVRVTFGGAARPPASAGLGDDEAVALALHEASAMLGVELEPARLRAWDRARFELAPNRAATGRVALAERARRAIDADPGLAAVGGWLGGSGLAQVVPDAAATADRLRRRVLFGGAAAV